MWRACQNQLPTKVNLLKICIVTYFSCPNCDIDEETIAQILWSCPLVMGVLGGRGDEWKKIKKITCSRFDFL
jgi:hypothetical protein